MYVCVRYESNIICVQHEQVFNIQMSEKGKDKNIWNW